MLCSRQLFTQAALRKLNRTNIAQFMVPKRTIHTRVVPPSLPNTARDCDDIFLVEKIRNFLRLQEGIEKDLKEISLDKTLKVAIDREEQEVVQFLLNRGVDANGPGLADRVSPLAYATGGEREDIFQMLLGHGAHPQESGALFAATKNCDIAAVKALFEKGVDVNELMGPIDWIEYYRDDKHRQEHINDYRNDYKGTALHVAVHANHPDMVELLLETGADKDIKDSNGRTALQILSTDYKDNRMETHPDQWECRIEIWMMLMDS